MGDVCFVAFGVCLLIFGVIYFWVVVPEVIGHLRTFFSKRALRDAEIDKQAADLDSRVKKLEKINKREKTDETPIRIPSSSSYDAGSRQRSRHTRSSSRTRRGGR
jgi:hypothetical protein